MLRRFTAREYINLAITVLSVLFLVVGISIYAVFENIIMSFNASGSAENLENKALLLRNYTLVELLSILIFTTCILLILKLVFRQMQQDMNKREETLDMYMKEMEQQNELISNLTRLHNKTIEYDKMKTEFFSNISHELKTPLSVILGAVQLMDQKVGASGVENKSLVKNMKVVKQNSYRLVRLINNILDITRLDSGYLKLNMVNCNIVYLIEEITQSVVPYAEQKGLALEFDTQAEEIMTSVDIDKIERIILNLLSNAIKFTHSQGKIKVKVSTVPGKVFITVKDTGPGIPKDLHSSIFQRYRQVNSELTREFEGSGIGLSLVKAFVELHDGNVSLVSEPNKGSEFIIELPIRLTQGNAPATHPAHNTQGRIVEAINIEFSDIYSIAS